MKWEETGFIAVEDSACVYAFLNGNEVLYIGSAMTLARALRLTQAEPNRATCFEAKTSTVLMRYASLKMAKENEDKLIHKYHPKGNLRCVLCPGQWTPEYRRQAMEARRPRPSRIP